MARLYNLLAVWLVTIAGWPLSLRLKDLLGPLTRVKKKKKKKLATIAGWQQPTIDLLDLLEKIQSQYNIDRS